MANSTDGHTIENSVVADISGYVPALALPERGHRQETRYKLRSSLREVTRNKRLRSCGLPFGDMVVQILNLLYRTFSARMPTSIWGK